MPIHFTFFLRTAQRHRVLARLSYSGAQFLFTFIRFCSLFRFLKLERTPIFAIYSTRFKLLVLIDILEFEIFPKISIEFASYFPLFETNDHSWDRKIVDTPSVKKMQILQTVENSKTVRNFWRFECSTQWKFLLTSPNSYFSSRIVVISSIYFILNS